MNIFKLNQKQLNEDFKLACVSNDFNTASTLFDKYYIQNNQNKFSSFLNLFRPNLNLYDKNNKFLCLAACRGSHEIVNMMLEDEKYRKTMSNSFSLIITVVASFQFGQLDIAKQLYSLSNRKNDLNQFVNDIFIKSCQEGYVDIFKYLTSEPEFKNKIDLSPSENLTEIKNLDIIHHFIYEFNMKRDHPFWKHILLPKAANTFFEKKQLHDELQLESRTIPHLTVKPKFKL